MPMIRIAKNGGWLRPQGGGGGGGGLIVILTHSPPWCVNNNSPPQLVEKFKQATFSGRSNVITTQHANIWLSAKTCTQLSFSPIQEDVAENKLVEFDISTYERKVNICSSDSTTHWQRVLSHLKIPTLDIPLNHRSIWNLKRDKEGERWHSFDIQHHPHMRSP